jgi:hypothetical protein
MVRSSPVFRAYGLNLRYSPSQFLRNPNRLNFDMALFKHFAIKETIGFESRAKAFNVFNYMEWGEPWGTAVRQAQAILHSAHRQRTIFSISPRHITYAFCNWLASSCSEL